jgi:hypothetical protein
MCSTIAEPSWAIRCASQAGTCPPWSDRSAVPERYIISYHQQLLSAAIISDSAKTYPEKASALHTFLYPKFARYFPKNSHL